MMIIVEAGMSVPTQNRILEAMFEARKEVFVDLLKWDVPVIDGRFEVDQFDDPNATYIIIADPSGAHLGSARLLDTRRPHILGDLYPELCARPAPRGAGVVEITRFCLSRRLGAMRRREIRNRLVSALVEFALEHGISTYTGVAEMSWLQQILAFGWDCRPLGVPVQLETGWTGALAIDIGKDTPARLAATGIWLGEECAVLAEAA